MKILVGCECTRRVRDALRDMGHEAWSSDVFGPDSTTEETGVDRDDWIENWQAQRWPNYHLEGDVRLWLDGSYGWDAMIAHPPCTALTNAGARWLYGGKGTKRDPVRWRQMTAAAAFYAELWRAPVPIVLLENPIMHRHAAEAIRVANELHGGPPLGYLQTVQPYMFGDPFTKATRFQIRGCGPMQLPGNEKWCEERKAEVHLMAPGPDRWFWRSRTYPGIAKALAQHLTRLESKK